MSISFKKALLEEYARVAHALSAPARLSILEQLAQGERGVEALAEKTGLSLANCSQHLQQLRRSSLVTSRRDGKAVIYQLSDAKILNLMEFLRIVDVRPADEYAAAHIPVALNVTLAELELVLPKFAADAEIVAYCRGPYCVYAHQAVAALRQHGFNARRLEGGLPEWREDGRPVLTTAQ